MNKKENSTYERLDEVDHSEIYEMYFKLYNDDNGAIREIKNTKTLDLPIVNIDYDIDGNIIGIEVIGSK